MATRALLPFPALVASPLPAATAIAPPASDRSACDLVALLAARGPCFPV